MQTRNILRDIEQRFDDIRKDLIDTWGDMSFMNEMRPLRGVRLASFDMVEEPDAYTVTMELPGVEKQEIEITIDRNSAHVRAEHKMDTTEERKGYVRQERSARAFERHIRFPEEVSPDGARASFVNGVLEIHVPKISPEVRGARRVEVS